MSLISATHWTYSYGDGHSAGETRRFGNLTAARAWAASVVPPVVTTNDCYWRDVRKGDWVEFTRVSRQKRPLRVALEGYTFRTRTFAPAGHYEAPVVLVPSVGELGWSP